MSSILSRAFKRRRVSGRRARSRSAAIKLKGLPVGGGGAMGTGALPGEAESVKEFVRWCSAVGIELHPNVRGCQLGM